MTVGTPAELSEHGPEPASPSGFSHIRRALVPRLTSSPGEVEALTAQPAPEASWYAAYRLVVKLRGGRSVRLFLKDLGTYRARKPDMAGRREREHAIYRHLSGALRSAGIEVPRFYGAVWHPEKGRCWLLLEDVQGENLKHVEFEHWLGAARVLGRMHRIFEGDGERLAGLAPATVYDRSYFEEAHRRSVESVRRLAPDSVGEVAEVIDAVLPILDRLAAEPLTLVHGAYLAINILLDRGRSPPRFCPVDWELGGVGPGLYDFGFFTDGFRGDRLAELWGAYRVAAADRLPGDAERVRPILDAVRVHKLLTLLDGGEKRGLTGPDVVALVRQAATIVADIAVASKGGSGRACP